MCLCIFVNHIPSEGAFCHISGELNEIDFINANPYCDYVFLHFSF